MILYLRIYICIYIHVYIHTYIHVHIHNMNRQLYLYYHIFIIDQVWESGFFDKDSFMEILGMWARTVVCGRARLGGIPCGFIAVETRSVECVVPADPADPETESKVCRIDR